MQPMEVERRTLPSIQRYAMTDPQMDDLKTRFEKDGPKPWDLEPYAASDEERARDLRYGWRCVEWARDNITHTHNVNSNDLQWYATARELRELVVKYMELIDSDYAGRNGPIGEWGKVKEECQQAINAVDSSTPPESWKRTMEVMKIVKDNDWGCASHCSSWADDDCDCGYVELADALRRLEEINANKS
jgi:hypothetical protein